MVFSFIPSVSIPDLGAIFFVELVVFLLFEPFVFEMVFFVGLFLVALLFIADCFSNTFTAFTFVKDF